MKMIYNEMVDYLLHLLSCALKNEKPDEKPKDISFMEILNLANSHSVANVAFYSIERLENKPEADIYEKWREIRDKAIIKSITQSYELSVIIDKLTEAEVDICPLKGSIMKEMYPSQDMRLMADLDILMDKNKAKTVEKLLLSLDYKREHKNEDGHDVYCKKPVMNVEMHNHLIDQNILTKEIIEYYDDDWKNLKQSEENKHLYYMDWNDFYIFHMAHLAKHYKIAGTGIRSIMDIYIFMQKHKQDLDRAYIEAELDKMGLLSLCRDCERLAELWFGEAECDLEHNSDCTAENEVLKDSSYLAEMTEYIVRSGTYGAFKNRVNNTLENFNGTKFEYYIQRLFPPRQKMYIQYSFLKKYPFLQPFCWIDRIVKAIVIPKKRKNMNMEIKYFKEINNEK